MAISNPLVITVGVDSKSLVRINQDNYGSEYYLRETDGDFRIRIRHSSESPQKNGQVFERHNVELTRTVFSTVVGSPDEVIQCYVVLRNLKQSDVTDIENIGVALSGFLTATHFGDLVAWVN